MSSHVQSPFMNVQGGPAPKRSKVWPVLAVIIGAVFVYAGILKAWNPVKFATDIQNFRILSWPLGVRLAFYLPWLEILSGLALITGFLRSGAVAILTGLTVIFICATISAKARGINLACGCFGGAGQNLTFAWHLALDFAILIGLLALLLSALQARPPEK